MRDSFENIPFVKALSLFFIILYSSTVNSSVSELMQAVVYKPGGAENLSLETVPKPLIQDRHVFIKVHYFAINRADILQRKGLYPPPKGESEILGLEVAGVIEETGNKCSKTWRYCQFLPGPPNLF